MELITNVNGYTLVSSSKIASIQKQFTEIDALTKELRKALLRDLDLVDVSGKNSFAKTVRLMSKLHDKIHDIDWGCL